MTGVRSPYGKDSPRPGRLGKRKPAHINRLPSKKDIMRNRVARKP